MCLYLASWHHLKFLSEGNRYQAGQCFVNLLVSKESWEEDVATAGLSMVSMKGGINNSQHLYLSDY